MNINEFIFGNASAADKLNTVKSMSDNDIRQTTLNTLTRICKECMDEYGTFRIRHDRREGNDWNSLVDGLYLGKSGKLCVDVYHQSTSTDTNTLEYASEFFGRGRFRGNTHLGTYIYDESDKVKVLRSILLEYVYYTYVEKDERTRKECVDKLLHHSIVNPVLNVFYNKLGPRHISLDWDKENRRKYYDGQKAIRKYAEEHVEELLGKSKEQLQLKYMEVFRSAW